LLLIASMAAVLLLTGIVNVYLGVHWPTDIAGGHLWGLVLLLPGLGTAQISGRASPLLASLP
jgi:membrane-associated phospholipid phosphatase